jgi:hypothetical protein
MIHATTEESARQWTNTAHAKDLMHGKAQKASSCMLLPSVLTNARQSKPLPIVFNKRTAKKSLLV